MMNLISFETPPPLGRQESTAATAATGMKVAKEASSSDACFHGSNLDLSLGISLSPGGNCSAASCGGAAMASYNGRQGGGNVGRVQSSDMVIASTATANTLSAGRGGNCHGIVPSSSWAAVFMPSPTGFMHPWSLAARQQKAAAEQDRNIAPASVATTYVTSDASVVSVPSAAVGWPPVHTSRRHLVTATHVPKPDAGVKQPDGPKNTKIPTAASPADDDKEVAGTPRSYTVTAEPQRLQANMFAKVHMDGCLIVRKINLRAHRSYDSLSRALTRMTRNFFCRTGLEWMATLPRVSLPGFDPPQVRPSGRIKQSFDIYIGPALCFRRP
ncbi:hypothetical protein CFC21_057027 [Triticum aestivum]|uniref:Auxin-responsive protein n=3 Tax=Triticum TaxID=4564 RepID=A0A9R0SYW1_TRITD|nr:hypothetical protein CFC21_057027 [Triticum aestivum]VAI03455.1 unnamed protein product [Triticum turgidum subsp. durum]